MPTLSRALVGPLALVLLLGSPGCSLFVSPRQQVTIQASDPAARLFVDGREVGTGQAVVELRRNDTYTVRAQAADGTSAQRRIHRTVSTTGVLDIIGGIVFLFPFLGALGPGFWQLDPDYLYLQLPGPGAAGAGGSQPGTSTGPAR